MKYKRKYESITLVKKVLFPQIPFVCVCVCVQQGKGFHTEVWVKMFERHCSEAWEMAKYELVTY